MDKNKKNDNQNQQTEDMLKDKTYQDYNKQKPNPNDPNQKNQNKESELEDTSDINRDMTIPASPNLPGLNNDEEKNLRVKRIRK